jgi:hypothetical protein
VCIQVIKVEILLGRSFIDEDSKSLSQSDIANPLCRNERLVQSYQTPSLSPILWSLYYQRGTLLQLSGQELSHHSTLSGLIDVLASL